MENNSNSTLFLITSWANILQFIICFLTYINFFPFKNNEPNYITDKELIAKYSEQNSDSKDVQYVIIQKKTTEIDNNTTIINDRLTIKEKLQFLFESHKNKDHINNLIQKNPFIYFWLPTISILLFLVTFIALLFYSVEVFSHGTPGDIKWWWFFFILDILIIISILVYTDII